MLRAVIIAVVCGILAITGVGSVVATAPVSIDVVAPHPVPAQNAGEFVVLTFDGPTNVSGWTIEDGYNEAAFPATSLEGSVALSHSPSLTELLVDKPVVTLDGHLPLSVTGDRLVVRDAAGDRVTDAEYEHTPAGVRWKRSTGDTLTAVQHGATDHPPVNATADVVTAFVLPDGAAVPRAAVASADQRLYLAGYELTDPDITAALLSRHAAGVDVQVLVDGRPVGGQSAAEIAALDELVNAGVPVRVLTGSRDRYRFHHPKYAVIDDRVIVMTENWKRAGTGGSSSRGWGVMLDDALLAAELATIFGTDARWRDAISWDRYRLETSGREVNHTTRQFPTHHEPAQVPVDGAELVVAPEAAEPRLLALIDGASDSIHIQQVRISGLEFPLLQAVLAAADRGVDVTIQLDASWYVKADNRALAAAIEAEAAAAPGTVEAELVGSTDRFEKIHTKGIIVDDETVVVGSMNWNNVSMRENREVLAILHGDDVAGYYLGVFDDDWTAVDTVTPLGLLLATGLVWIGVGLVAVRHIRFAVDQGS